MPETIFKPEKVKDAIKLAEETLERKVTQVDGKGKHRLVRWKSKDFKTRIVFSREPLKNYGATLGTSSYRGENGVSLEVEAFQESLKQDEIREIVHVTGEARVYVSEPETWRDFLNNPGEPNPIWDVDKTEERVISLPVSKLQESV